MLNTTINTLLRRHKVYFFLFKTFSFFLLNRPAYLLKTLIDFFQLNDLETQFTQLYPPFILIKPS